MFDIKEDKVVGVENVFLENKNNDSIANWLKQNSIKQIYLSQIDIQTYQKLNSKGIKVKTLESIENDKLFKSLALIIT